jgi:GNAT superfamily N-acetyltransferase
VPSPNRGDGSRVTGVTGTELDALSELAIRPWGRPQVGLERLATPERLVELWPSFPIPGPNHVCLVRCAPARVDGLIDEVRRLFAARGLPGMWILDPDVGPADLADRLLARGIVPSGDVDVMVLPATASVDPGDPGIEIVDALSDEETFWSAEAVQTAAFRDGGPFPGQHQRFEEARADPARRLYLALVDDQPAGAGWATIRDEGVLINGGAVDPHFQGRGVYRALVAARLRLAREVGAAGVGVQARPDTSGPILAGFGFRTVGRWTFHIDR